MCGGSEPEANRPLVELVIPPASLQAAMTARASPGTASSLDDVVDSSRLGESLFSDVKVVNTAANYETCIEKLLDELVLGKKVNMELHNTVLSKIRAAADEFIDGAYMEVKRQCKLKYGGHEVTVIVTDPMSEGLLRYGARLRAASLGRHHGLDLLPFENLLTETKRDESLVEEAVLADIRKSRSLLAEIMANPEMQSFGNVQSAVAASSESILALDASSALELAFVKEGMLTSIARALEARVLGCLPDAHTPVASVERSLRWLDAILEEPVYKISSRETQSRIGSVRDVIYGLSVNKPPPQHLGSSVGWFGEVFKKLPNFVREEVVGEASASGGSNFRVGTEALKVRLGRMAAKIQQAPHDVELSELERLHPWSFMMSNDQRSKVADWIKINIKARSAAGKKQSSASSGGARAGHKDKKDKKEKKETTTVASFFGGDSD